LHLSLGPSKVWGDSARPDPLAYFFSQEFVECNLMDLDPVLLKTTWKNNRVWVEGVAKRLERFLITESLLDKQLTIKQWIDFGGMSDHYPTILEYKHRSKKPTNPFKFKKNWLEDDSFLVLLKENWIPFQ